MTTKDLYTKGAKIWVPHRDLVWESAELLEDYEKNKLKIKTEDGQVRVLPVTSDENLPPLRNPDYLTGENDLTSLSYVHEPAVLHNLQVRFCGQNAIYTYCGIVLVAINPYTDLSIYDSDTVWAYRGKAMGDLDPHIFAVAEEAYTKMEREDCNQSIIVSGESGAGKTVSAKYAMRYFATIGGSATETHLEKKVLASSPIMEAIGNAKTTRNDNSSRFGKFIELHFNKNYNIVGTSMRTYLLEKSRVVFQAPDERNYHILYQLCAARKDYPFLQLSDAKNYRYLCQETVIPGIDDAQTFQETYSALITLGFTERNISEMFCVLASILHLGNISIEPYGDNDESYIEKNDPHLLALTELLQIDAGELRRWLCQRRIISMREVFDKPMTVTEAEGARDALAKHMYAEFFAWIVAVINRSLESSSEAKHRFIGVLDIYGFETFEVNSFEQFCINYANEKIQQQFNQHVFKLEQEEYMKEDIEWKFIEYYDNQPCIDLIESKLGILDLLDEECRMPKGSASSWAEKLYSKCTKWDHFAKPRFGTKSFIIRHFADQVEYEINGFLEKNRDTFLEEQVAILRCAGNMLIQRMFRDSDKKLSVSTAPTPKVRVSVQPQRSSSTMGAAAKQRKKTVASQFHDSLNALMKTLNATIPHYIRCIKPNDNKAPFEYDPVRAVQQLRACGVLETIRISAAGFPSRVLYVDFFNRYRVLCHSKAIKRDNYRATCEAILHNFIKDNDKFKFGKTKIFFRIGQVAYLEKLRSERLKQCCVIIQKTVRGSLQKKRYLRIKGAIKLLQRVARGYLARKRVTAIRQNRAATILQKSVRGWLKRVQYQRLRRLTIGLQARARGLLARQRYQQMRYNHAALIIQTAVRGWICRCKYLQDRRHVIIAQNAVRRFLARRKLRKLKLEARSVEHVKKLNKGLENKIISLQQRIGELVKENSALKVSANELVEVRSKLDVFRGVDIELKKSKSCLQEKDIEIKQLLELIEKEKDEKTKLRLEFEEERNRWNSENKTLKDQVNALNEEISNNRIGAEEVLRARLEEEKLFLINEQDQDRDAYQKLLSEKLALESHCDELEREINKLSGNKTGNRHMKSLSDVSSVSTVDESSISPQNIEQDEDFGYSSVRSTSNRNTDWSRQSTPESTLSRSLTSNIAASSEKPSVDIGLTLKLQQRLKALENELEHTYKKQYDDSPSEQKAQDAFKLQELEMENSKIKSDLAALRKHVADSTIPDKAAADELMRQFEALQAELVRLREECVQLRGVLANQTRGLKSIASTNYAVADVDMSLINEDGELVLAFEAQKKINRQLEDEKQECQRKWNREKEQLEAELARLRDANDIFSDLSRSPQTQIEAYLQSEITRIVGENLELQEKKDMLAEKCRRMKRQLRELSRKVKEPQEADVMDTQPVTSAVEQSVTTVSNVPVPVVRKKERNYNGMFEFKKGDETVFVRRLILDLKPQVAVTLLPGLPAYILFMCIRHTDFVNDEEKVRALLTSFINTVKKVIRTRNHDFDTRVLWLSNTLRFLHNLKQYSGEKAFKEKNTPMQNEQCLRNFDLSEYRQVLSDIAVWIYQAVIRYMEEKVQTKAVAAILEHEAISGLSSGKRGRAASVTEAPTEVQDSLNSLLQDLTSFHRTLVMHGVDQELIIQVFRQLFYYICASSLNNLLLRKDLYHWAKGMQIRYNVSHLEQWARDQKLQDPKIVEMLAPIIQAAQLLQARKTEDDVASVCDMCNKLTTQQIMKILKLYTPADDLEERVPAAFIRKVQQRLKERSESQDQPLLMDTKYNFPVRFPFNPSDIRLEDVEIPEVLNLPMLKKV